MFDMDDHDAAETVGKIAYAAISKQNFRNAKDVNAAAAKVYGWLKQPTSKFRALTALFSGGGLFHCASVHEKCHRAYINHGYTVDDKATVVPRTSYAEWAR